MSLPCLCHALALSLPCLLCHVFALSSPCFCHVFVVLAMYLPCRCPWQQRQGTRMATTRHQHVKYKATAWRIITSKAGQRHCNNTTTHCTYITHAWQMQGTIMAMFKTRQHPHGTYMVNFFRHAPELCLPCVCHVFAMSLPCYCVLAMLIVAMLLPCLCCACSMSLLCRCPSRCP
jgi:hypothetical protein